MGPLRPRWLQRVLKHTSFSIRSCTKRDTFYEYDLSFSLKIMMTIAHLNICIQKMQLQIKKRKV